MREEREERRDSERERERKNIFSYDKKKQVDIKFFSIFR